MLPGVLGIPDDVIGNPLHGITLGGTAACAIGNETHEVLLPEHLVHHGADAVDVPVADLDEDRSRIGEQVADGGQAVAQVAEVGVDALAPSVAEGAHLLRLARDVLRPAVPHVAAGGRPLEVGVEADPVRRVHVDALHLLAQPLPLRQRGHHLQAVAQDHAVRPPRVVLVETGGRGTLRQPVEVGKEVVLEVPGRPGRLVADAHGLAAQVLDQGPGVDALLDVERRRKDGELVGGVLRVLAAPDQLRVEVAVAAFPGDADGCPLPAAEQRLVLRRGDERATVFPVRERVHLLRGGAAPAACGHATAPPVGGRTLPPAGGRGPARGIDGRLW